MSEVSYRVHNDDQLTRGIFISLAVHLFILFVFAIKTIFYPSVDFDYQAAVRVDLVGLPDKINPHQLPPLPEKNETSPEAKSQPSETSKPEPIKPEAKVSEKKAADLIEKPLPKPSKTDDSINLDKSKSKERKAIEKLKRLEALDKIKSDVAQETVQKKLAELAAASKAKSGSAKIKGNMISQGTDLVGIEKLQHEEYRGVLDRHIKQNWVLPEWIGKKKLRAQALVRIDEGGRVISKQIIKSSGSRDFDDSVLETIDRSSPMPSPPEKFISLVRGEGILIEFGE